MAAVVLVLCAGGAFAAQIVRDGQSAAEIILDTNSQASVRVAAEQIQKYVEKMSGAKLDIVAAPTDRFPSRLYVGQSAATKALGFTLEDVNHDGYKIWAKGDDVIVAGHDIDWYAEYGLSSDRLDNVDRSGRWREFTGHKWRSPMFIYSRESMVRTGPPLEFHPQIGSGTLYGAFTDKQEPKVDGDLTKAFWWYRNEIKPEYTFYPLRDMFTGETPRHVSTHVSFRYTHGSLFIAVNCHEPKMDRIQASCTEPDNPNIWSGDFVEIRLETPNGRQPRIVVNPSGAVYDSDSTLPRTEDLPEFYRVAACAVRKLADRWTVEVQIDEASLGAGMPTQSFPWGVQVSRQRLAGNTPEFYQLSPTCTAFNRNFEMMANLHVR